MDIAALADLVRSLVWPATILVIFFFLRPGIKFAIDRIEKAKVSGAEFSFGSSEVDNPQGRKLLKENASTSFSIDWSKVGNLYWLSHDIMWSIDALLRDAPKEKILHGLRQTLHHAESLNLGPSNFVQKVSKIFHEIERLEEHEITALERERAALQLRRIADQVGALAEANQPDFESEPE